MSLKLFQVDCEICFPVLVLAENAEEVPSGSLRTILPHLNRGIWAISLIAVQPKSSPTRSKCRESGATRTFTRTRTRIR